MDFERIDFIPGTNEFFLEMAEVAFRADGHSPSFLFSGSLGGDSRLHLSSGGPSWTRPVSEALLQDLAERGMLRVGYGRRGTPNYTITALGHSYYRWLREQQGAPMVSLEESARRFVASEGFTSRYPRCSASISEAAELLWTGDMSETTVTNLGVALRSAIQDFAEEFMQKLGVADEGDREKPINRLRRSRELLIEGLGVREPNLVDAYIELAEAQWRQAQRLIHVREHGQVRGWDELRRSVFGTLYVVYELDSLAD